MSVDQVISALREASASMRCSTLQQLLESLGFEVRAAKKPGHKVVTHSGLIDFISSSYTCGHGRDPEVKPNYIRQMRAMIEQYRDELVTIQGDLK